jgi:hypothetical protein
LEGLLEGEGRELLLLEVEDLLLDLLFLGLFVTSASPFFGVFVSASSSFWGVFVSASSSFSSSSECKSSSRAPQPAFAAASQSAFSKLCKLDILDLACRNKVFFLSDLGDKSPSGTSQGSPTLLLLSVTLVSFFVLLLLLFAFVLPFFLEGFSLLASSPMTTDLTLLAIFFKDLGDLLGLSGIGCLLGVSGLGSCSGLLLLFR